MTRPPPKSAEFSLDDVQHFVLEDASWELYEQLLRDIGNRPIRVTYDDGRMEIMSPLPEHERPIAWIGRLIETLAFELEIPLASFGSTTFRRRTRPRAWSPIAAITFSAKHKCAAGND